jgi:acetate kinase
MRVLVFNAGSSSLKASVLDLIPGAPAIPALAAAETVAWGSDASRGIDTTGGVEALMARIEVRGIRASSIAAVAHRIVHGGSSFTEPVVIDEPVLAALDQLAPLAPLHNAVALRAIRVAQEALPRIPQVAVFDTAFHATLPEVARRYPVPVRWTETWGVRRFGFHGLSVEWSTERAAGLLARSSTELGLVVAHLGNGCSATAVLAGRSIATSMGMTPLEGLMMGTRAGSIDPGILLRLLRENRLSTEAMAEDLDHRAGLLGVSGSTADVKRLTEAADAGDNRARLALEMFADRAAAGIAGVATALPRMDAIVFTGGIGEHAGRVRAAIANKLGVLDVRPIAVDESGVDRILATVDSRRTGVPLLRIEAREDIVAARAAARLLQGTDGEAIPSTDRSD